MESLLSVEMPPEFTSGIRAAFLRVRVEDVAAEDASAALNRQAGQLGALIVGPGVDSPVWLAEQAAAADPHLTVLILCQPDRAQQVAQELRFSAFVGPDVRCVILPPPEPLADLVRDAVIRTRRRRRHRDRLIAAESETRRVGALSTGFMDRLRESEERFRAIFEQVAVGVAQIETQTGQFIRINQKYCEIVGIEAEELTATTFMTITHPEDLEADLANMERLEAGEIHEFSMEKRYIRPDGTVVWVNLTVSPMWKPGEQPRHHIAVVEDITGRKEAEEALRQSEERFRCLVESVMDAIVTIDVDSRILSANRAAEELFGYAASELVGQPLTILMPESLRAAHTAAFNRYVESGERRISWEGVQLLGRHKNEQEIPLEISFGESISGGTQFFTGILRDISARKREEKRLLRAAAEKETLEKLAKLTGQVDSGVTLEEVLEQMFEAFEPLLPYDRIGYALVEDGGRTVRSLWVRSKLPGVEISVGYSARLEGSSLQAILASGRPRILNDLEGYLREHPDSENTKLIVAEGMRSSLTCPLIAMGKPVGFLFFSSATPHTYDQAHVELYLRVAEHLSLIIEKSHLYRQVVEAKHEVEVRNQFIAEVFGRYTSDAIASRLLESPEALKMGGETREVTILFADLCGFTPLCAELDPQRVVRLLNIHLGAMAEVITSHGGTIDEFLGDAVLAIFGAPVLAEDDAQRALACAIAMQNAMEGVNRQLSDEGLPALQMGIAVHTGEVVVGNIGSRRRAKYGIVGAVVNQVTRIEEFTSGGQILCSEDTLREVGDLVDFDESMKIPGKGGTESVQVVSVRRLRRLVKSDTER
jgi:PAS domain S-box-containing protein